MACICKELQAGMPPGKLRERVKDAGNISRLFPNVIPAGGLGENTSRSCALADGSELTERIVTVDDELRRLADTITQSPMPLTYHHAWMQIFASGTARDSCGSAISCPATQRRCSARRSGRRPRT